MVYGYGRDNGLNKHPRFIRALYIIDDVVHKSAEEGLASGTEETTDETPERDIKKEADA